MLIREATAADVPQIARVHVDSWRTTYAGIVPADFLEGMSYEDFEVRWRGWMSESGGYGIFYVAELPPDQIIGFASGGPRREDQYPEYEGELYADAPIFKVGQLRCSSYVGWDLGADGGDAAAIGASTVGGR